MKRNSRTAIVALAFACALSGCGGNLRPIKFEDGVAGWQFTCRNRGSQVVDFAFCEERARTQCAKDDQKQSNRKPYAVRYQWLEPDRYDYSNKKKLSRAMFTWQIECNPSGDIVQYTPIELPKERVRTDVERVLR